MKLNKNSMNTLLVKSFEIINIFSVFERSLIKATFIWTKYSNIVKYYF